MVQSLIDRFRNVATWRREGERAPHKPLLILLALGCFSRGQSSMLFSEIEVPLTRLLKEFGPSRKSFHPEYPFWRLANDGLWVVEADHAMVARVGHDDPPKSQLRSAHAAGQFPPDVQRELKAQPALVGQIAREILEAHFPPSLHQDVLDAVGLSIEDLGGNGLAAANRRPRDPDFRGKVMVAYSYRCAVCDLDMRLGNTTVGLDAAHIQWHAAQGPDRVSNGMALCTLHHKLFDLGAFTLGEHRRILVSEQVNGSSRLEEVLLRHHGQFVRTPQRSDDAPAPEFIGWHQQWVFKREARGLLA